MKSKLSRSIECLVIGAFLLTAATGCGQKTAKLTPNLMIGQRVCDLDPGQKAFIPLEGMYVKNNGEVYLDGSTRTVQDDFTGKRGYAAIHRGSDESFTVVAYVTALLQPSIRDEAPKQCLNIKQLTVRNLGETTDPALKPVEQKVKIKSDGTVTTNLPIMLQRLKELQQEKAANSKAHDELEKTIAELEVRVKSAVSETPDPAPLQTSQSPEKNQ